MKPITVDDNGVLMSCFLAEGNIFSDVVLPKGLKIEHYKAESIYSYYKTYNGYQWKAESRAYADEYTINFTNYSRVIFYLSEDLEIVKFEGEVKTTKWKEMEIRELIKKGGN